MPASHTSPATSECCPACGRSNLFWWQRFGTAFIGLNTFKGWSTGLAAALVSIKTSLRSVFPSLQSSLTYRFRNLRALLRAKRQGMWWKVGERILRAGRKTEELGVRAKAKAGQHKQRGNREGGWLFWIKGGKVAGD
ncbi:hypothetical protein F4778DRAFT_759423 [Xylariomycetidae sp. FL2044]|nr:hypothetical protein F4778DRAFT_759423 [Xylariomycetidae sp. FL2044]